MKGSGGSKPTPVEVKLAEAFETRHRARWDDTVFNASQCESDLPVWARHHPDLNDPIYMYGSPEADERRHLAENPHMYEEPDPPDYFFIFKLWMIYVTLQVIVSVSMAAYTLKTERWDTLTADEKEAVQEDIYQWLKPHVEQAVEDFEAWQRGKAMQKPDSSGPSKEAPRGQEALTPLVYESAPLYPPDHYLTHHE